MRSSKWLILLSGGVIASGCTKSPMFVKALCAPGPLPERAEKMRLYEPVLGDWEVEVIDYAPDGRRLTSRGEWHFAWVLEGRAIQDVFIVPPLESRRPGQATANNRYGTTLRVYDPAADVWRITWINPVSGIHTNLVARREGNEIVHEGNDGDGSRMRWIFSDITPTTFRWRGERSTDEGKTWQKDVEFFAKRAHAA
jgi:hypothetical protein